LLFGNRGERKLTLSPYYPGLSQENKLEFDGEFLMEPSQLKAALTFWLGCEKGIERLIKESAVENSGGDLLKDYKKMQLSEVYKKMPFIISNAKIVPGPLKASLRVKGYEQEIYAFGSKTLLDVEAGPRQYVLSCQDILKEYFSFFKQDISKIATSNEMKLLKNYINGNARLGNKESHFSLDVNSPRIDPEVISSLYGISPSELMKNYKPNGMTSLYADAMKYQRKVVIEDKDDAVIRETVVKHTKRPTPDWDGVSFKLSFAYNKGKAAKIYVPRDEFSNYQRIERNAKTAETFFEKAVEMFR